MERWVAIQKSAVKLVYNEWPPLDVVKVSMQVVFRSKWASLVQILPAKPKKPFVGLSCLCVFNCNFSWFKMTALLCSQCSLVWPLTLSKGSGVHAHNVHFGGI